MNLEARNFLVTKIKEAPLEKFGHPGASDAEREEARKALVFIIENMNEDNTFELTHIEDGREIETKVVTVNVNKLLL